MKTDLQKAADFTGFLNDHGGVIGMLQMYRLLREFYQHVLRPLFRIIF